MSRPAALASWLQVGLLFVHPVGGWWQVWEIAPKGLRCLTHDPLDKRYPSRAPDGRIAYATVDGSIWILKPGGGSRRLEGLPPRCRQPAWSPDGRRLALTAYSFPGGAEEADIWVVEPDGGKATPLVRQPGVQRDPAWSPDGSRLVYAGIRRLASGRLASDLWVVDLQGRRHRLLRNDALNLHPSWSPDGRWIAFASDRSGDVEVWLLEVETGRTRRLTHCPARDDHPSWSPDGSAVCFVSTRSGRPSLWTLNVRGDAPPRPLLDLPDCLDPCWR